VQKLHEQLDEYKSDGMTGRRSLSQGSFGDENDYEAQRTLPIIT